MDQGLGIILIGGRKNITSAPFMQ